MAKALREGAEIVVATPGRLMELIASNATNMKRVSFLVLDEADRMFEMGFEYQVKSLVQHTRPDRQTLLFSATFATRIESLALQALTNPVRIQVGKTGESSINVAQSFVVLPNPSAKELWIVRKLKGLVADGKVLIFVGAK